MTEKEEEIIKEFKMKKINPKLKEGIFCGYRGVTISSRELTELQKLKYATLAETIFKRKPQVASGYYIDIDELIEFISVNENFSYGPYDYGMMLKEKEIIKNYKEEETHTIQKIQHRFSRLKAIKEIITDKEGKPKDINQIEDIDFEALETGMLESGFYENVEDLLLFDYISGEETENTSLCLKKILNNVKKTDEEKNMTNVEIALQRCNTLLEEYQKDINDIEETKRKAIESYIEAKENYLDKENIFDPNGIVPATIKSIRKLTHEEEEILDRDLKNLGISFDDGTSQPQSKNQKEGPTMD